MSRTRKNRQRSLMIALIYLAVSAFCLMFGVVYEQFSHEVYSSYMTCAFLMPLIGGALPYFLIATLKGKLPDKFCLRLYNSGIATLTVGSLIQGALDIYGTTNSLMAVYAIAGGGFIFLGVLLYLFDLAAKKCAQS